MKPNACTDPNNLTYTAAVDFLSSEMPLNRPFLPWKAHLEMLRVKEPLNKHAKTDMLLYKNSLSEMTREDFLHTVDSSCSMPTAVFQFLNMQLFMRTSKQLPLGRRNPCLWNTRFERVRLRRRFLACLKVRLSDLLQEICAVESRPCIVKLLFIISFVPSICSQLNGCDSLSLP